MAEDAFCTLEEPACMLDRAENTPERSPDKLEKRCDAVERPDLRV